MKKVITYGTFDLFHQGHYNLLKRAKELGDYLIVGVTTEHFDEARGKVNVIDSVLERVDNVRKTGLADEIIIEDHNGQKIEDIQKYGIDIFTVGSDWIGTFDYLNNFCKVVYLERTPDISSTMLRKSRFKIVNMGIVGTGRIAPRFVSEAKYVSGINITCAYNPQRESGKRFQRKYDIECETGEYEEFLNKVDAVYIASTNETHYDYVKRALLAGKHVLSEKPVAFTKEETIELYLLAKEKKLVLIEGVKTAYCPGFQQLINVARSGKIGEICDVEACFSRLAALESRERSDEKFGGSFLEFGGYSLLPIIKLMGSDYKEIRIDSVHGEKGIDLYTKIQLLYEQGMATAKMGVGVKSEGQLVIAGTKGYILAQSPWWLTKKFEVRYEDPNKVETYEPSFQGDGLRYEISEFVSKINGYGKNGYKLTAEESIAMAEITELFMKKRNEEQTGYYNQVDKE
ncbi:MAG: Gfo/Idh/MocA family oxidoreductase [Clostridiales bacterium]|nr:Gfo/Idh/MocA family oxidoreductase [Clostridiales bacterium]